MSETEKSWLAAVIDGEGSIGTTCRRGKTYPRLEVCNTDFRFIERCFEITGVGTIYEQKHGPSEIPHRKTLYRWRASSQNVVEIAAQVMDYLVIKKEKANAAIQALA